MKKRHSRRTFLRGLAALGATAPMALHRPLVGQEKPGGEKPKFLIVLTAYGGGGIVDSLMAIRRSESSQAETLTCYADDQVRDIKDSPFRAVRQKGVVPSFNTPYDVDQYNFVLKHHREMLVTTQTVTSVNHDSAQWRAVTGNGAWGGRTLQEAVAYQHGQGFPLPNVHLSTGMGFVRKGTDPTLPARFVGEVVPDPSVWPFGLDPVAGIQGAPSRGLAARARQIRNQELDRRGLFHQVFQEAPRLKRWMQLRGEPYAKLEDAELIKKLLLRQEAADFPLSKYGLERAPEAEALYDIFPSLDRDIVEAQAAMVFLLLKHRVSASVTLGPNSSGLFFQGQGGLDLRQPTLGFDFSHTDHISGQAVMWDRVFSIADRLIDLLKSQPFDAQETLWDRTLLYIATDFGRTRQRPRNAERFPSGHDLNNGVILISPLVRGNTLLGGVNPETALTYGFDPKTGVADPGREMSERDLYSGILNTLDVDTSGANLPDMSIMKKT